MHDVHEKGLVNGTVGKSPRSARNILPHGVATSKELSKGATNVCVKFRLHCREALPHCKAVVADLGGNVGLAQNEKEQSP